VVQWLLSVIVVGVWVDPGVSAENRYSRFIARTKPLSPQEQQQKFHLPPGFEIQLVAAEPEIRKPINLNFDSRGRLLVTVSVEYPFLAKQGTKPRDAIKLLSDADGDGFFDTVQTFAEGLNIPVGVTPGPRGVLAFSVPRIDRFIDTDGDGRADQRENVFGRFDVRDTHGMPSSFTWWIDGWVYACHGETNISAISRAGGNTLTLRGGSTFRLQPNGSQVEQFAAGQVNPFGLCFDPLGNLYTADSHSRPAYLLLRGATYPSLAATGDGLGFGPQMMRHFHGSTGMAGIAYYAADHFPAEYRGTLFIGNPVTGRINHDRLEIVGSTMQAVLMPDFLTCDDPWFRPVDVQLGPDGALYIADFYNRIIAHSAIPLGHVERDRTRGRIWRVVYSGRQRKRNRLPPVPDLSQSSASELIRFIEDPNLVIRTHATHQLVERIGNAAVEPIGKLMASSASHPRQRVHGLWVLHRLGALDPCTIRRLAGDADREVRVHLMKALAEQSDWGAGRGSLTALVRGRLSDPDPFVRRAAADALGRHRSAANVDPLLKLWAETPADDTLLIHTARMALRDNLHALGNLLETTKGYQDRPDDQRRLADVSLGIRSPQSAAFLFDTLQTSASDSPRLSEFLHHAARYLEAESLPQLYAFALGYREKKSSTQRRVLRSLFRAARERGRVVPAEILTWGLQMARKLVASDEEQFVFLGIELAWDLKLGELGGRLAALAGKDSPQQPLRSFAIDALAAVDSSLAYKVLGPILADAAEPIAIRQKAADALGKINSDRGRQLLNRPLSTAPAPVANVIAQQLAHSRRGANLLIAAVESGQASARLLQDAVVEQRLGSLRIRGIDQAATRLTKGLPPEEGRLARLIFQRRAGFAKADVDSRQGALVFEKHCHACHQIGGKGNKVGPSLDGIGLRGLDRLLEDVLDPHRNVAGDFRSSVVVLKNGRVLTGLVLSDAGSTIVLVDAEGKHQRIAAADIDSRRRSPLSPMPANVADKIPESDFYRLIGYLLSRVQPVKPKP
jgi:putative heme-binding domain-containing protein